MKTQEEKIEYKKTELINFFRYANSHLKTREGRGNSIEQVAEMYLKDKKKKNKKYMKTQEETPKGLHKRYYISKVNGEEVDENAEYFVLRLDKNGNDINHINACRKAIITYANEMKKHLPILSSDLIERYSETLKNN